MNKLDKELYIKHAKRLSAIIDEKSTFAPYLKRKDFNVVLKKELNVLAECEKLFPKVELEAKLTAKSLVKTFNNLTTDTFELDEKYKYEDETDLIDVINYLFTFCNNMFRVNLDDLIDGKTVTATDPKIDLKAKADFGDTGPRMNSNFAFAGGVPLADTPYENPYFAGKAYAKLNEDVKSGKFYQYKTKPKIIPIVKWASLVLTILTIVGLLIASIFSFIDNRIWVYSVSQGKELEKTSLTMSGVFYLLAIGFGSYTTYIEMKTMVGKAGRNDNFKYFFNWGFIVMFLVIAILFAMFDVVNIWLDNVGPSSVGTIQEQAYWGLRIILILVLAFSGLNIISIIIGGVCNPKPDPDIVEKKIREYIDMFSAESGQMPVPPKSVDVQKPTKVEDPKTKKTSEDKKDTTSK